MESDIDIKIEKIESYSSLGDLYCRCCFKITNSYDLIELQGEIMSAIQKFIYNEIDFTKGSKLICEECHEIIQTLVKYRNEISMKQSQFSILILKNEHRDLKSIKGKYFKNALLDFT